MLFPQGRLLLMWMAYQSLAGKRRNARHDFSLGIILAMVAGAINAGGFFLIVQYTSHMTGIISIAADSIAMGEFQTALKFIGFIFCFIGGAICTTLIILFAKRYHCHSQFALPLFLEAMMLILFSWLWKIIIPHDHDMFYFIAILCFIMGLQNALITKVSSAIIRTTHITGMATDIGIEVGRLVSGAKNYDFGLTKSNLKRHIFIILAFFTGGVMGAVGVNVFNTVPFFIIAFVLVLLGLPHFIRDGFIFSKILKKRMKVG